jgi:excinuclease ABC subunit A
MLAVASNIEEVDSKKYIVVKGARMHNLKNIDIVIPRNKFVVITGVSGSGKSSLAFDTIYAEGQRRYVESLSAYARQFLGKINKPDVDYIRGIAPAIAIEQKVVTRTSRSTVGTSTEIYDYLKLLFARLGKTYSPVSGKLVKRNWVTDVVNHIFSFKEHSSILILSPLKLKEGRSLKEQLQLLLQQGFSRVENKGKITRIDEMMTVKGSGAEDLKIVIDRIELIKAEEEELRARTADSVQTCFYEGGGMCQIEAAEGNKTHRNSFSDRFEADGIVFEEPSVHFFSFNNPVGACKRCEGFGSVIDIDEDLVIPDKTLSIYEDAIVCWKGEKMSWWKEQVVINSRKCNFPIHRPIMDLTEKELSVIWEGNKYFEGLNQFFKYLEQDSYKIQNRVMLSRYRGKTLCPDCKGTRLRKDANYVKIGGKSISEIVLSPANDALEFFRALPEKLDKREKEPSRRLLHEITNRLQFLCEVGLGYLTLNRNSNTLSGGESQRLNLATSLGSSLVGSLYILDEPSIGLHHRDTQQLIKVLKSLRDLGNTLIVVEHDEDIMRAADVIIDIGPLAGTDGGKVVFQGGPEDIKHEKESLTALYLNGKEIIPVPQKRRPTKNFIEVVKARENNLKGINVKFPVGAFTVVSGVSGSGKSSLVKGILYPGMKRMIGQYTGEKAGNFDKIAGDTERIKEVEMVDQSPIGRSSRSNPVTYLKAFDEIRTLFAEQKLSTLRGYKASDFSFNVPGGRCDVCEGEGVVTIEMQFMADVHLLCDACNGRRYKDDVLEVEYNGKSISDILNLTVDEAIDFFGDHERGTLRKRIVEKLRPLKDVGMGYVHLGQSSSTLSGGEAQRIKLATFLSKGTEAGSTLFIFDEPTTGLHFHDIKKLLNAFRLLVEKGHTLVVIEHHPDVIKCADWLVDLGPEGGVNGGNLVFQGVPEDILKNKKSYTADCLKDKL